MKKEKCSKATCSSNDYVNANSGNDRLWFRKQG